VTDAENFFEWAEKELSRMNALDESKFTEENALRIDEKKNQLKNVLSFRKDGDSSSPVSRSEDQNGEGAVQDAQSRVSGEPPKTLEELPTAAVIVECSGHCNKKGVNLFYNEEHQGNKSGDGTQKPTFKLNMGCEPVYKPLVRIEDVEKLLEQVQQD